MGGGRRSSLSHLRGGRVALRASVAVLGAALGLLLLPGSAPAPLCPSCTKFVEQTPTGFAMTLNDPSCGHMCSFGTMVLRCPTAASEGRGASLGKSAVFKIRSGKPFTASNKSDWSFTGRFDSTQHFKGSGRIAHGACGSAPRTFTEPVPKNAVWTQCPTANPVPSNTPITFKGQVVGAALGTSVRIEFGDPHSGTGFVLAHVTTDAAGNFQATHTFPSLGGQRYGAPTWARYPDSANAHGALCNITIK